MRLDKLRETLRSSLWAIPTVFVAGALGLAQALTALDRALTSAPMALSFSGGPDAARQVLSTIASSMITFTGLVFTITIVVLQLASGQFSPRVLRTFLRDRTSTYSLAVFVSTFAYALMVLREVRSAGEIAQQAQFVPRVSVTVSLALVLVSLGFFVRYIDHIAQQIRVASIISSVARETREAIERMYPAGAAEAAPEVPPSGEPVKTIASEMDPGVLVGRDDEDLVRWAEESGSVVAVVPAVGDFVPTGSPLLRVWGGDLEIPAERQEEAFSLGRERTMQQDVAFGFRQLVDIAERALSPGTNDPTTAVQALDHLHDLLRRLAARPFPPGIARDRGGTARLFYPTMTWDGYVSLAVDEIRQYGAGSLQVARRLRAILFDLRTVVPPDRLAPVERELTLLDAMVERSFPDAADRSAAAAADEQGQGS